MTPVQLPDIYSNRSINDVTQDHTGLIWIANNSGLYFYDGVECRAFKNEQINGVKIGKVHQVVED